MCKEQIPSSLDKAKRTKQKMSATAQDGGDKQFPVPVQPIQWADFSKEKKKNQYNQEEHNRIQSLYNTSLTMTRIKFKCTLYKQKQENVNTRRHSMETDPERTPDVNLQGM